MIVVYNQDNGNIDYTIEKKYKADFVLKEEKQEILITDDEKIRANTHKINLDTEEIEKI